MTEKNLGLPLEYLERPELFDAQNICDDTEKKNQAIENILKNEKTNSVLDLSCGTGSQVFYLLERNYQVIGADISPHLLDLARNKAKEHGKEVEFIEGDMRNLQLGKSDAVITIFNAIGHLTKKDFEIAIQNIASNLKDNGIYIFDIFNLEAINDEMISKFDMEVNKTINDINLHHKQHSTLDKNKGILTSYDKYNLTKKDGIQESIEHNFSLQIYKANELEQMLNNNGFDLENIYSIYGEEFIPNETTNMLIVSRKRS